MSLVTISSPTKNHVINFFGSQKAVKVVRDARLPPGAVEIEHHHDMDEFREQAQAQIQKKKEEEVINSFLLVMFTLTLL